MSTIYLDNNATTRPLPAVVEAVREALEEIYGNPSSIHPVGERARERVVAARETLAGLVKCRPTEVVFTSCATESINTAVKGAVAAIRPDERPRVIRSSVEHEATIEICDRLQESGVEISVVPVDAGGCLDLDRLQDELRRPATLITLMLANNETGVLFPIEQVGRLARAAGVPLHVDAVQGVGKVPLDVEAFGCDFLSLSGHKFHAPKGVGLLYIRRGARCLPLMAGASQEGGRRAGTENVPGLLGFAAAAAHMGANIPRRRALLRELSDLVEKRLLALPDTRLNGDPERRVPGTVNVSFAGIEGSAIVLTAAREGVCISAGSACSASQHEGSHVMEAMGVPFGYLHGSIRVSCAESTTRAEVETALDVIERSVAYLRSMTPGAPLDR